MQFSVIPPQLEMNHTAANKQARVERVTFSPVFSRAKQNRPCRNNCVRTKSEFEFAGESRPIAFGRTRKNSSGGKCLCQQQAVKAVLALD
jgi:hypothetical protein